MDTDVILKDIRSASLCILSLDKLLRINRRASVADVNARPLTFSFPSCSKLSENRIARGSIAGIAATIPEYDQEENTPLVFSRLVSRVRRHKRLRSTSW